MKRNNNPGKVVLSLFACISGIVFLLLVSFSPLLSNASPLNQTKKSYWFVSGNTGIAIRSPNVAEGFDFSDEGFRHQPGFAFDVCFGRTIGNRWEPAIRWGAYTLFGQTNLPHYSSAGYYSAYPALLEQEPLEYVSQSNAFSFVLRFLFRNSLNKSYSHAMLHPFIEAGLGINNYTTEVRYSKIPAGENAALIFRNRNGENANGAVQVTTGLGLKIGAQGEWNALILMNADWVEFTSLNTVSQITNTSKSSSRAIVSRITAGLTIPIKRTIKRDNHLPFRW